MQPAGKNLYEQPEVKNLCKAFLALQSEEECVLFLQDLMTIREIQDMTQRLSVAQLLREGLGYSQIMERVSVSSATISRVNRCLSYGDGGYETVLSRIQEEAE
ncbi:MAG: hypothetical protein IKF50_04705 [Clostridia bacterium]|nr:hypothetical protein [Clostridia bacterium]